MTAQVYFCMQLVPRTTTREEWYTGYRRVREMRRQQTHFAENARQLLTKHNLDERIRRDIIDHMVNPPIILGPWM